MPARSALNTSTTLGPTSASETSRRRLPSNAPATRQTLPPARCGRATATSCPGCVWILDVGPPGSGPIGGAVASALLARTVASVMLVAHDGEPEAGTEGARHVESVLLPCAADPSYALAVTDWRQRAQALDEADPLGGFRARFVHDDAPSHLPRRQLARAHARRGGSAHPGSGGRLAAAPRRRLARVDRRAGAHGRPPRGRGARGPSRRGAGVRLDDGQLLQAGVRCARRASRIGAWSSAIATTSRPIATCSRASPPVARPSCACSTATASTVRSRTRSLRPAPPATSRS